MSHSVTIWRNVSVASFFAPGNGTYLWSRILIYWARLQHCHPLYSVNKWRRDVSKKEMFFPPSGHSRPLLLRDCRLLCDFPRETQYCRTQYWRGEDSSRRRRLRFPGRDDGCPEGESCQILQEQTTSSWAGEGGQISYQNRYLCDWVRTSQKSRTIYIKLDITVLFDCPVTFHLIYSMEYGSRP